jgi:hypothetical protein
MKLEMRDLQKTSPAITVTPGMTTLAIRSLDTLESPYGGLFGLIFLEPFIHLRKFGHDSRFPRFDDLCYNALGTVSVD